MHQGSGWIGDKILGQFLGNRSNEKLPEPLKAAIAFTVCTTLQKGISVLTTPIFTRLLSTEEYGYYSLFISWQSIVAIFSTLCLTGSMVSQAIVKNETDRDGLVAAMAGLGTVSSVLCLCLYLLFSQEINRLIGLNTIIMVCVFISSWATMCFSIWALRQRVEYKYKRLTQITLFTSTMKPLAGVVSILLLPKYRAEARIVSMTAVEFITYALIFFHFLQHGNFFNKKYWTYAFGLAVPLIPHYLTRMFLNQSDRVMINALVGTSEAGIYGLAHSLAFLMTMFNDAVLGAFSPWFFSCLKSKSVDRVGKVSYGLLLISACANFIVIALAPEVIRLFAPAEYYEAIWVIPPLSASVFFLFMYSLFADIEYFYEKSGILSFASAVGGVANIILNYVFIKRTGYLAAGYTTLLCYVLYVFLHYAFSRKLLKEYMNGTKLYNLKIIVSISVMFMLLSAMAMLSYNTFLPRFGLILAIIGLFVFNRRKLIDLLAEMR